ncbi:MAG: ferrochelatase [Myxococcota bacterium]
MSPTAQPGPKTGVLLVNLGTPDAPETAPVRRYLRQFLSDRRVLTLPAPLRWLLLNLVILPTRPAKSAAAYKQVWLPEGSPLLVHSRALTEGVAAALGEDYHVELAMRYGHPSIERGLDALDAAEVDRIVVLPLFPQYASSVTASVSAEVMRVLDQRGDFPPLEILGAFHDAPGFIDPWAALARPALSDFGADHVLFSFHGLPEDQIRASDPTGSHCLSSESCCDAPGGSLRRCYRAQCYQTAEALRKALGLAPEQCSVSFQSRLGPRPWIQPFTDEVVPALAGRDVKRLAVFCPSFVADCLETLEEIGIRLREQWTEEGGDALWLSPCPNGDPGFAEGVAGWIRASSDGR